MVVDWNPETEQAYKDFAAFKTGFLRLADAAESAPSLRFDDFFTKLNNRLRYHLDVGMGTYR